VDAENPASFSESEEEDTSDEEGVLEQRRCANIRDNARAMRVLLGDAIAAVREDHAPPVITPAELLPLLNAGGDWLKMVWPELREVEESGASRSNR
jgi:hypothetical protein